MSKASPELLENIHDALAKALLERIKNGTASAADLGVARQLLKDNGIDSIAKADSPLANIRDSLPFPSTENVLEEKYN